MATAVYPVSVQTFAAKNPRTDNIDPVMADDVNVLYAEVTSIEATLGTTPATSSWGGSFDGTTTTWSSVASRLTNIESGVYTAFNDRVKISGGSTIAPSNTSTVALKIQSFTGSTQPLFQAFDSSSNANTVINSSGYIAVIDGGTA